MNKLTSSIKEAVINSGLRDGMTVSFHHHLRNGDYVLNILTGDVVASADIDAGSTDTTEPVNWDDVDYDDGIIDDGQQSTDTGATGTDSLPETTETVGTGADADSDLDISWDERE